MHCRRGEDRDRAGQNPGAVFRSDAVPGKKGTSFISRIWRVLAALPFSWVPLQGRRAALDPRGRQKDGPTNLPDRQAVHPRSSGWHCHPQPPRQSGLPFHTTRNAGIAQPPRGLGPNSQAGPGPVPWPPGNGSRLRQPLVGVPLPPQHACAVPAHGHPSACRGSAGFPAGSSSISLASRTASPPT